METPTTLDELEEQIRQIIPNADFEIDEDTGHVTIFTNLVADDDGDLTDSDDCVDRDSLFDDDTDELDEDDEEE